MKTSAKIKEVVKRLMISSFCISLFLYFILPINKALSLESLATIALASIFILLGPIPSVPLAISFPEPFTIGLTAASFTVSAYLANKVFIYIKSKDNEEHLNYGVAIGWCIVGAINVFMVFAAGA